MDACVGNKYPITDIGMPELGGKIDYTASAPDKPQLQSQLFENQGSRSRMLIQVPHPQPRGLTHVTKFTSTTRIDCPFGMPPLGQKEGDPPLLEEEYTYVDLHQPA